MEEIFEHICEGVKCGHYIVWDFGFADCYSCTKIGQSYHVTEYPEDCPFKKEISEYLKQLQQCQTG